ncbi:MAG TPA: hypothetical protein VJB11_03895 [archaeon]|nr:hypothetical protein [archaeon]
MEDDIKKAEDVIKKEHKRIIDNERLDEPDMNYARVETSGYERALRVVEKLLKDHNPETIREAIKNYFSSA